MESSFKHQPLYPKRISYRYSFGAGVCGSQIQSGQCGEEGNLLPVVGIEPESSCSVATHYVHTNYVILAPTFDKYGWNNNYLRSNSCWASQIPRISGNPKDHFHVYSIPPLVPTWPTLFKSTPIHPIYSISILILCRSQWPRGLRRTSAAARLLGLWVRIPPEGMDVCLLWVLCGVR